MAKSGAKTVTPSATRRVTSNVPAYREKEEQTEIRAGRGTLVGRVALECRPVLIADAWNDPEYEDKEGARLAASTIDAGRAVAA